MELNAQEFDARVDKLIDDLDDLVRAATADIVDPQQRMTVPVIALGRVMGYAGYRFLCLLQGEPPARALLHHFLVSAPWHQDAWAAIELRGGEALETER